jgi:hypothetical protein
VAEAQGGPCVVEPSCAPATLLAAESGEGVAAVRADAQLQQVEYTSSLDDHISQFAIQYGFVVRLEGFGVGVGVAVGVGL